MDVMSIKDIEHKKIMKVVKEEKLDTLEEQLKGIKGVAKALGSDTKKGIPDDEKEIAQRRKRFGWNTYKKPLPKGFFRSVWQPLQEFAVLDDFVNMLAILIVSVAAYGFGSYSSSAGHKSNVMNKGKIEDKIEVLRGGKSYKVPISEIVVGDLVCLKIGDKVPADGLLLRGENLHVESMTDKISENDNKKQIDSKTNPFLFSGCQVVDGSGCQMMVTSVGMKAKWCELMRKHGGGDSSDEEIITTVEHRVNELTRSIRSKVGLLIASLGFVAMLARYFTGNTKDHGGNKEFNGTGHYGSFLKSSLVEFLGTAFTTVLVVIPESLRLGVALTVSFSKRRMMADMEMVSELSGYETMGSVTTICTNRAGTLTMNQMKVTDCSWHGGSDLVKNLFLDGIASNTSSSKYSPIDKAILSWAVGRWNKDVKKAKDSCKILKAEASKYSSKKRKGVLMKRKAEDDPLLLHVHWKGEAAVILEMCSKFYDNSGEIKNLDDEIIRHGKTERELIGQKIEHMAKSSIRCIAFAYHLVRDGDKRLKATNLVLLGWVGIEYPCRRQAIQAVKDCLDAGVNIKLVTGDDDSTAIDIAIECGILDPDNVDVDAVIEGSKFRGYSKDERMTNVHQIRVMANSTPDDKLLMVKTLKEKGDIVAVAGNTKGNLYALIEADIGISMGIEGNEVAKKVSDIVILDGNFASVATVLKASICIYNNVQKFIQFQLTLNFAALAVIFISAVSKGEIPLNSGDVLWLNLIVNTLASLALATDKPTQEPIKRQPVGRKEPLISNVMWRNLLAQVLYQIAVVLTLLFKAESILGFEGRTDVAEEFIMETKAYFIRERNTFIFHAFLLCQVFNEFNGRNLEKKNVFKGIYRDKLFLVFIALTISVQVVFLELFLNKTHHFERLKLWQWSICIGFGFISWPIAWVVKSIPVPEKPVLSYLGLV